MSDQQLPISAVLPIYNCRERLERHLRSVVTWASKVREIIVVDSGSTDGTLEMAQEILTPFGANFIHNPPGLYQSWNAGITAATSPWCYISTVEDPISLEGLSHLLDIASLHDSDVVISPPEMMNHDGTAPVEEKMPSNRLADAFTNCDHKERVLNRFESMVFCIGFLPSTLLGSSASNLYKSSFMKGYPFPSGFGSAGDSAWAAHVAGFAKIAFTPQKVARFYKQTVFKPMSRAEQLKRQIAFFDHAAKGLESSELDPTEQGIISGWLSNQRFHSLELWQLLVNHERYQRDLESNQCGGLASHLYKTASRFLDKLLNSRN